VITVGIAVNIIGMNKVTGSVPYGSLIVVNSSNDPSSRLFMNGFLEGAFKNESGIVYFASPGMRQAVESDITTIDQTIDFVDETDIIKWPSFVRKRSLIVFDSFSYLVLDKRVFQVSPILEELKRRARMMDSIVLLNLESGMLDTKFETLVKFLADGVIEFRKRENSDSIQRYMMIPKWNRIGCIDTNIYFTIENGSIKFDLRSRVV
jgi:KaiC/GvpD/RAD55 family RecA-like ATPase